MKKYTDVQLSKILSDASGGILGKAALSEENVRTVCIEESAKGFYCDLDWQKVDPYDKMIRAKHGYSKITKNPERMLEWLEEKGMA